VSVPTGVYFNGYDFVKVESTWVRIKIGQGSNEYSFRAETNPLGCVLRLLDRNGNEVGIISISGNKLVYNGTTYSKK
ncbi:MAG: hypothetical protein J1E02_09520, partial [Coprobacter sp.]|nr:hypothetical protein [Coprobacter sp.]